MGCIDSEPKGSESRTTLESNLYSIFFLFVCVTIILFASCTSKKRTEEAEKDTFENKNKMAISELAKRYNADDSWPKALAKGEDFRIASVLTIELEKYWLTDRPIIFLGFIKDIMSEDLDNYRIIVDESFMISDYNFSTEIQLSLVCPRLKFDSFIKEHPDYFDGQFQLLNGVALVAKIDKIEIRYKMGTEGNEEEVRIGKGKCLDLMYIKNSIME